MAPVRGLYWFTLSVRCPGESDGRVLIRRNGEPIAKARSYNFDGDAVSTILMLEAGDWMDCVKEYGGDVLKEEATWRSNTFAGFLYAQLWDY